MLKHKLVLPILAVIVGVAASAFTVQKSGINHPESVKATSYYWFVAPYNGSEYQGLQTESNEVSATGCDGQVAPECQRGFTQNQLVNGDPTQGVISSQKNSPANKIYEHQ
jgi:hypothetical protein